MHCIVCSEPIRYPYARVLGGVVCSRNCNERFEKIWKNAVTVNRISILMKNPTSLSDIVPTKELDTYT